MQSYKKVLLRSLIIVLICTVFSCSNKTMRQTYKTGAKVWTSSSHSYNNSIHSISKKQSYSKKSIYAIKKEQRKQVPVSYNKKPKITTSSTYPRYQLDRAGFSMSTPYSEYYLNININTSICRKQRIESRLPKDSLRFIKNFRKAHIQKQTTEVQARMKKSRQEAEKINRKGETFFDRVKKIMKNII